MPPAIFETTPRETATAFRRDLSAIAYGDIPVLRAEVTGFLEQHGLASAYRNNVLLSLSEILTNLVKHPKDKASLVRISVTIRASGVELDVADDSTPFATFDAKCNSARARLQQGVSFSETGYGLGCILAQHTSVTYRDKTMSADDLNHFTVSDAPQERPVVFLIDDDPVTLRNEHQKLAGDFDVVPLQSARDALALFHRQKPDLVISDLVMPDMDGAELRREMSKIDGGNAVPFIFLSASKEQANSARINGLGVDDFLCKPVSAETLVSVAQRLVTRSAQLRHSIEDRFHKDLSHTLKPQLPPHYAGWSIALRNRMAEAGGGDFTLHHQKPDNMLVVLADVMGHGKQAKFFAYAYAGYLRSLFRLCADNADPADFMRLLSQSVGGDAFLENIVMTCQGFRLFANGDMSIATAGHPPPFLLDGTAAVKIDITGPLPGLFEGTVYPLKTLRAKRGQKIIFATDGFFDDIDVAKAPCPANTSAEETADYLWRLFLEKSDKVRDDATLIVAEYKGDST